MKKLTAAAIFLAIIGVSKFITAQTKKAASGDDLPTVANVDLKRYSGKWFEIARYPNRFEKKCVGNTTATYTLKANGKIEVLNQCLKKDGSILDAKGEARVADKQTNSKLEVRFAPKFLSFIPAVWGDYWILYLDDDYQNVAIGDRKREYFWILSRQPQMAEAEYQKILEKAESLGFVPAKVIKITQNIKPAR